jgi:hypothetical protein
MDRIDMRMDGGRIQRLTVPSRYRTSCPDCTTVPSMYMHSTFAEISGRSDSPVLHERWSTGNTDSNTEYSAGERRRSRMPWHCGASVNTRKDRLVPCTSAVVSPTIIIAS